ncbi:unnamed protein product [Owenia fusiformis]|uniref:Uncharacterized protein n=1 Tax=Owenia fusiformis TaxID=6347 RepID=A0A8J1TM40_OWEFU|nr:unnamed protein product [Owenia fusiformis]
MKLILSSVFILGLVLVPILAWDVANPEEDEEFNDFLASLKEEDLPTELRRELRQVKGDNNHWCCRVSTVKTISNTYSQIRYVQDQHRRKSYGKCGLWGWKRCSRWSTTYSQRAVYDTKYAYRNVNVSCPANHLVCCNGYHKVANHCLPLDKVGNNLEHLEKLKQAGKLGRKRK